MGESNLDFDTFCNIFKDELLRNNLNSNLNYKAFYKYMKELLIWNEKINLTAIKDEKEFIIKHFIDSLTIKSLVHDGAKVIDVGTGGGFPGIPLKIACDSLDVTLIDSVNKKIMVVNDIIEKLQLNDIKAIHSRAEDIAHNEEFREKYDFATSRAVSNLTTLIEYLLPFVKVGGKVICMKGANYEDEIKNSLKAIKILGGEIDSVISFKIDDEFERNIIIINKVTNTSLKYPRNSGLPLKKPLI